MPTPPTQPDLFIANASVVRQKDLTELMTANWHSLSKRRRLDPIVHHIADYSVRITSRETGIATIYDHDVMIFLISQIVAAINRGAPVASSIHFTGYDLFRFLNPKSKAYGGKRQYDLLWAALRRLRDTTIETTFRPKNHPAIKDSTHIFSWLSSVSRTRRHTSNAGSVGYRVSVDPFFFSWICDTQNVLTIDPGYFQIRTALAKWLYLWARKSVGMTIGNSWTESLKSLYAKSASQESFGAWTRRLRSLIATPTMPGFRLEIVMTKSGKALCATRVAPSVTFLEHLFMPAKKRLRPAD